MIRYYSHGNVAFFGITIIQSISPKKCCLTFNSSTQKRSLLELCVEVAPKRGCDLSNPVYKARLERELVLIKQKDYGDYFYLVWDLVRWAKEQMLVGPARGSSAGSLVCYLLFITDVDPIPFNLIFDARFFLQ